MDIILLKLIEKELSIRLPDYYKDILKQSPFSGYDVNDSIRDCLVDDEEWIIIENRELRENGFLDQKWPDHLLAIGHNGGGGYFFINLRDHDDNRIYLADHEALFNYKKINELEIASDMDDFINYCIEIHGPEL